MEAYTHHRSRSRAAAGAPRPPPTASFSSKKPFANGNGFTAYDDVFGGPPKFGAAPPFAPRAEDYMEIFGSFLSSRASSIPILDLPPVDDSVSAFDFAGARCDYTDVFGGLEFADFAVPYDELFRRSDGGADSSDEAWTPTGSVSEESDPSANSERNQCFLNGDYHQPVESKQFNVSYHQVNTGTMEDSSFTRVAQVSAVPGYTYMVRGSTSLDNEGGERRSSRIDDDIILMEDPCGNISLETLDRSFSDPSHDFSGKQFYEPEQRSGGADGDSYYFLDPTFVQVSDIDAGSNFSQWQEQSRPHKLVNRSEASVNRTDSKNCVDQRKAKSSSLPFPDVDVDVSLSALASVEAIKEAMQRAELKMKSAKESMERKKDSRNSAKPNLKIEVKDELNAGGPCDESAMETDALQSKFFADQKEIRNHLKGTSDSSEAVHPHDFLRAEWSSSATGKPLEKNVTRDHSPSPESGSVGEDDWKEASQYFELVNNGNFKAEPESLDKSNKVENELKSHHFVNEIGKHMPVAQQDRDASVVGSSSSSLENGGDEDSDLSEEDNLPRENRPRLRAVKASSRQDFHQKMVKVAQEFHERVTTNHVDAENKLKKGWNRNGSDGKSETCFQVNEQTNEDTAQMLGPHAESPSKVRNATKSKEAELAEYVENGKEASKGVQESDMEAYASEENCKTLKACRDVDVNGRTAKEAAGSEVSKDYCAPKGKRRKEEVCPGDDNGIGENSTFELKKDIGKAGRGLLQQRSGSLEEVDSKSREINKEVSAGSLMKRPNEILRMEQQEGIIEEAASYCYEAEKDPLEHEELETLEKPLVYDFTAECKGSDVAQKSSKKNLESHIFEKESMNPTNSSELKEPVKVHGNADKNIEKQEDCRSHVESGLKIDFQEHRNLSDNAGQNDQQEGCSDQVLDDLQSDAGELDSLSRTEKHLEAQQFASVNQPSCTNESYGVPHMAGRSEEPGTSNSSTVDMNYKSNSEVAPNCEDQTSGDAIKKTCENEDTGDCKTQPMVVEDKSKAAETVDSPVSTENSQKQKVAQSVMREEKEPIHNRSQPTVATRKFRQEGSASSGNNVTGEESGGAERLKRERDLEEERVRKLEEEREREREREKDRMGVELGPEACGKVDRTTMDRATAEARQRAMAEARERLEKACAEARGKSVSDKSSAAEAARLKAERAAVERATTEARVRAIEKLKVEKERLGRSISDNITTRYSSLSSSSEFDGTEGETAERCKARLERHRRTVERVAKALAEKNMRDVIAQREQAERNRFAETLDADIKRWSNGKEGNLRALLSTLQYILGAESGWQPIPLTEVITSAAVKKAYRKATLCVHPDKLQQRGATIQQKYICEKVFDLLKDGWNKFNSEER